MRYLIVVFFIITSSMLHLFSQVKFAPCFGKDMVLQQDMPVKLWGTASKGEQIQVVFQRKTYKTKADKDGNWIISTAALKAGGPFKLSAKSKKESHEIDDVYVGEVWIAGGQSNMEFDLSRSTDGRKYVEAASNENIRFLYVPRPDRVKTPEDNELIWKVATREHVANMSAVAYHFASNIQPKINVPIGIICCYRGGSSAESWIAPEDLRAHPQLKSLMEFDRTTRERGSNQRRRSTLYEDMLTRVIPFTSRGVIWYQGEANAARAEQYKTLFPYMIASWRKYFSNPTLPFYFVQLPKFGAKGEPHFHWAELRDAQLETWRNVPNTAMVVALDCGEENQLHPKNKKPIGERLALIALNKNYKLNVPYSGPLFKSASVAGNQVVVSFDYAESGLTTNEDSIVRGFELSGDGKTFYPANAEIKNNNIIVVSTAVKKPIALRYGWKNFTDANLYNQDGLMASPFSVKL